MEQIDYYKRINEATKELANMQDEIEIRETFSKFRHLSRREQDQFLECIRQCPKLYSMTLAIQNEDERLGIGN